MIIQIAHFCSRVKTVCKGTIYLEIWIQLEIPDLFKFVNEPKEFAGRSLCVKPRKVLDNCVHRDHTFPPTCVKGNVEYW